MSLHHVRAWTQWRPHKVPITQPRLGGRFGDSDSNLSLTDSYFHDAHKKLQKYDIWSAPADRSFHPGSPCTVMTSLRHQCTVGHHWSASRIKREKSAAKTTPQRPMSSSLPMHVTSHDMTSRCAVVNRADSSRHPRGAILQLRVMWLPSNGMWLTILFKISNMHNDWTYLFRHLWQNRTHKSQTNTVNEIVYKYLTYIFVKTVWISK